MKGTQARAIPVPGSQVKLDPVFFRLVARLRLTGLSSENSLPCHDLVRDPTRGRLPLLTGDLHVTGLPNDRHFDLTREDHLFLDFPGDIPGHGGGLNVVHVS